MLVVDRPSGTASLLRSYDKEPVRLCPPADLAVLYHPGISMTVDLSSIAYWSGLAEDEA